MFPKKNRITKKEFPTILNQGKRFFSSHLSLVFVENHQFFKTTVVVSKKINRGAPQRNRQKRVLREIIKKIFPLNKKIPYSCIFFVKKSVFDVPNAILEREIRDLSLKIK